MPDAHGGTNTREEEFKDPAEGGWVLHLVFVTLRAHFKF